METGVIEWKNSVKIERDVNTLFILPPTEHTTLSLLGYDATSLAHLYLGSYSHSLQILSSSVRLDGERLCTAIFRSLKRCLIDRVQVQALAGPLKDIQRLVPKSLLRCLGCVLRVVVLLEGEPSPQSEVLSALEQVFIKDLSVLYSVHLSLNPD